MCPYTINKIKTFPGNTDSKLETSKIIGPVVRMHIRLLHEWENQNNKLHPNSVTGFTDGESTFSIKIRKRQTGWSIQPCFQIELHNRDIQVLKNIQLFFRVGNIRENIIHKNKKNYTATYSVESIRDLTNAIIPHFDKYPLITQKSADFELFKMVVELMSKKKNIYPKNI
jgi:hypothetical protein